MININFVDLYNFCSFQVMHTYEGADMEHLQCELGFR